MRYWWWTRRLWGCLLECHSIRRHLIRIQWNQLTLSHKSTRHRECTSSDILRQRLDRFILTSLIWTRRRIKNSALLLNTGCILSKWITVLSGTLIKEHFFIVSNLFLSLVFSYLLSARSPIVFIKWTVHLSLRHVGQGRNIELVCWKRTRSVIVLKHSCRRRCLIIIRIILIKSFIEILLLFFLSISMSS